jgi:membrane protease YdiL (CAAX protease family)
VGFAAVFLVPFGHCVDSLITLLSGLPHDDWSITTLASAVLGKEVLLCTVAVGSLSLLCRRHGTSLSALMQLDFKQPLEVLRSAADTYILYFVTALPTLMACFAVLGKVPSPSEVQEQPVVIEHILQSGDSAAGVIITLTAVILGPITEELIFRWAMMT